jgi:dTDP-4-dehydrorhamnose 3,5-epimerase
VPPYAQDKLVRVVVGEVFDVVVDLRRHSPGFGRWEGFRLSAANRRMLLVPKGFAHGFCVLSATAEVLYKCSAVYHPEAARGFRWDDPRVGIQWPVAAPVICGRDRDYPALAELSDLF